MKHSTFKALLFGLLFSASLSAVSCKSKNSDAGASADTTMTTAPVAPAPVEIAEDDTLSKGVTDATKDYPGVTAQVVNGEIILGGELERSKLPDLMQSLNSLRPKRIDNTNLTLK